MPGDRVRISSTVIQNIIMEIVSNRSYIPERDNEIEPEPVEEDEKKVTFFTLPKNVKK